MFKILFVLSIIGISYLYKPTKQDYDLYIETSLELYNQLFRSMMSMALKNPKGINIYDYLIFKILKSTNTNTHTIYYIGIFKHWYPIYKRLGTDKIILQNLN